MILICPKCKSDNVVHKNHARRIGGSVGTLAGAVSGVVAVNRGARVGAVAGSFLGPAGPIIGSVSGAVIAGLIGGVAGGSAGLALGEFVDDNILNNYKCQDCGHSFTMSKQSAKVIPFDYFDAESDE
ncbi:MAG: complement resistance protein TraT [Cellvibrionaceae bacterium]